MATQNAKRELYDAIRSNMERHGLDTEGLTDEILEEKLEAAAREIERLPVKILKRSTANTVPKPIKSHWVLNEGGTFNGEPSGQ